jgi:hypothetical protein
LDAGALVIAVEVFGRMKIAVDDVLHLGEEIGICDLKIVPTAVRLQSMLDEDTLDGRSADGSADRFRVFFEVALRLAQGPPMHTRKGRRLLAIHRDGLKTHGL